MPAVSRSACCPHRVIMTKVGIKVASNMIYIRVRLLAIKVREMADCRVTRAAKKVRCRPAGSLAITFWPAKIVSGRSQYDSRSRGVEMLSRWRCGFDWGFISARLSSESKKE